jgi:hypothetical protein
MPDKLKEATIDTLIDKIDIDNAKSTIIDGVLATSDIDSSGESLNIEGADISSLTKDGVLNREHADPEKHGFDSIIGKCILAKKILKEEDCTNARERFFFEKVEGPFIYGQFRLFDGAGHKEAQAAAAIIRDAIMHKEPVLIRYSVEGSTLKREGNSLEKTVIRRIAATIKPCNKASVSGVLEDPVTGFKETKKSENLITYTDNEFHPEDFQKALTAGMAVGAPSGMEGGAALQREWLGGYSSKKKKKKLEEVTKEERPTSNPKLPVFKETTYKAPELSAKEGVLHTVDSGDFKLFVPHDQLYHAILHPELPNSKNVIPGGERVAKQIQETVHEPWNRAMEQWKVVNSLARQRKLPEAVLWHAAAFASYSRNTHVNLQEKMYDAMSKLVKDFGYDATKPIGQEMLIRLRREHADTREKYNAQSPIDIDDEGASKKVAPYEEPLVHYHEWHPQNWALVSKFGDQGDRIAKALMDTKVKEKGSLKGFNSKMVRYMLAMSGAGDLFIPDRHGISAIFNLQNHEASDEGHSDVKKRIYLTKLLTEPKNYHLLREIDKFINTNHPVSKHVLEKHPEHFKSNQMQSIFPTTWLMWLMHPWYDKLRGLENHANNLGTDHYSFWHNVIDILHHHTIPTGQDNLAKQELRPDPLPMRTAAAQHEIEDKYGSDIAGFAYFAYILPALQQHEFKNHTSPQEIVRKVEAAYVEIKEAYHYIEDLQKIEASDMDRSAGELTLHTGKTYNLIAHDGDHYYIANHGEKDPKNILKIQKNDAGGLAPKFSVKLSNNPNLLVKPEHAIPHLTSDPKQLDLINGIDFSNSVQEPKHFLPGHNSSESLGKAFWTNNAQGDSVFVKKGSTHLHDTQGNAEAAVHQLANNFFGLGEFVPTTTAFKSPINDRTWVAVKGIPHATHRKYLSVDHRQLMDSLRENGTIDKMVLMDSILGNTDRNSQNYVISSPPDGKQSVHLIDHGGCLQEGASPRLRKDMLDWSGPSGGLNDDDWNKDFHKDTAKWVNNLDPAVYRNLLTKYQIHPTVIDSSVNTLNHLRTYFQNNPNGNFMHLYNYLWHLPQG